MELNLRAAVRGLMINPADQVLLIQLQFPDWSGWVLPGGGVEPGEDHVSALHRELAEETGVPQVFVGPPVWRRRIIWPKVTVNGYDGQDELVFLVPCHTFRVAPAMTPEELRAEGVIGHRWWSLAELAQIPTEDLRPRHLHQLVATIVEHGAPTEPQLIVDDERAA